MITVGADDVAGTRAADDDFTAPFSAYGYTPDGFAKPDVGAPGRSIVGAIPPASTLALERPDRLEGDGYIRLSGTSLSTPVVSGAAAQILSSHPDWTPGQVKGALMLTALPLPAAAPRSSGVGEVDAAAAAALSDPPNANAALDQFVITGSDGLPTIDTDAWSSTAQRDPGWASAYWGSAYWGSAAWSAAYWGSAYWGSAYWGSTTEGAAYWGSAYWGSAYWGSSASEETG